jgi:hypothetical protein
VPCLAAVNPAIWKLKSPLARRPYGGQLPGIGAHNRPIGEPGHPVHIRLADPLDRAPGHPAHTLPVDLIHSRDDTARGTTESKSSSYEQCRGHERSRIRARWLHSARAIRFLNHSYAWRYARSRRTCPLHRWLMDDAATAELPERSSLAAGRDAVIRRKYSRHPLARIWHAAGSETQMLCLTCTNVGGPGWDRTSDLPRVKRTLSH